MSSDYRVLGLMSGTSLDGLDLCLCDFYRLDDHEWRYEIVAAETVSYGQGHESWKRKLTEAYQQSGPQLNQLNGLYAKYLGETSRAFLDSHSLHADFIASHGHTTQHDPDHGWTYQLGGHQNLALSSGLPVVCDFRTQDVALGGQGAPLVPIGDRLLFNDYTYCINLGGFCNVSYEHKDQRFAFDIAPCNMLLNELAALAGKSFDADGQMARSGKVIEEVLERWNGLGFYQQSGPRSLGREWYETHFNDLEELTSIHGVRNMLATAVEHIARQVSAVLEKNGNTLLTGGGAKNEYLVERIRAQTADEVLVPETLLIDYKEALIFAFLGVLKWQGEINVLSSVTGASKDHSSGKIFYP